MPNTRIILDKWLIPQLQEVINIKMAKGDIQAELDLTDSQNNKKIRVDLKQLFIIVQALIHVNGTIGIEERKTDSILQSFPSRQLFIVRNLKPLLDEGSWEIVKDLTNLGITQNDLAIKDQIQLVNHNWNKE